MRFAVVLPGPPRVLIFGSSLLRLVECVLKRRTIRRYTQNLGRRYEIAQGRVVPVPEPFLLVADSRRSRHI